MSVLNPFGFMDNNPEHLVRVEDVQQGLACNCFCPQCRAQFIAVQPIDKQWHFRHYHAKDCGLAFETAVHLLAKKLLAESKRLFLPELKVIPSKKVWVPGYGVKLSERIVREQVLTFDQVEVEKKVDQFRPDIVLYKDGRKLVVEIEVTHGISKEKQEWLKKEGLPCIVIHLAWARHCLTEKILRETLRSGRATKDFGHLKVIHWVHRLKIDEVQERIDEEFSKAIRPAWMEEAECEPKTLLKPNFEEKQLGLFFESD